jgi:hypothetical protein
VPTIAVVLGSTTLRLDPKRWPVVAALEGCAGAGRTQTRWTLTVRGHRDGRRVVVGQREDGQPPRVRHAGALVGATDAVAPVVERVGRVLGADESLALGVCAQLAAPEAVGA